jgi:hypothetical protein
MRKRTLASGLAIAASVLVLGAMTPACGGSSGQTGFGSPPPSGTGPSGSSSGGMGPSGSTGLTGSTGGTGPSFNLDASVGPMGPASDAGCAGVTATATSQQQPVVMEFILDGSGSMKQQNKWTAATAALTSIFNDMAAKNDPGLYAGLLVFSDANDNSSGSGPYPGSNDVNIAQVNSTQAAALEARYGGGDMPANGTPTGSAMTGGYGVLEPFTGAGASAKKVLILITDGVPTDNCAPTPPILGTPNYATNACITQAAGELTKAAPAGPIETFAIGVGVFPSTDPTNFDPSFLGYLAQSGGSGPAGCNPSNNTSLTNLCYFEVDPSGSSSATQTAFETAINAIRGKVATLLSCTFKLTGTDAGMIDPSKVNVIVNGMAVPPDPVNGWTYDNPANPTSVTLHGMSCAEVTGMGDAGTTTSVSIQLGCATIPPPQAQ